MKRCYFYARHPSVSPPGAEKFCFGSDWGFFCTNLKNALFSYEMEGFAVSAEDGRYHASRNGALLPAQISDSVVQRLERSTHNAQKMVRLHPEPLNRKFRRTRNQTSGHIPRRLLRKYRW